MNLHSRNQPAAPQECVAFAALDISGVSHRYGERKALDDVCFSVKRGSFCALLGLNGAGKTTLFSLITRLYNMQSGSIKVFGFDINGSSSEALKRLGVVFQQRTLDLDLTVKQNLRYHAALHGLPGGDTNRRIECVLDQVGLARRGTDIARNLSGGQVRRVEIARALLHHPQMMLLDEPTVGLDIKVRADILKHVRNLVTLEGLGVLWATHLIDEVEPGDDVVLLHQGKVLDKGSAMGLAARANAADIASAFKKLTEIAGEQA
ncbi:MAG TPA: ABC transporter ATP-binding protein [Methylocella sp.]|nr:ABC transporter ATP-binding protein [Methylocella sp.]